MSNGMTLSLMDEDDVNDEWVVEKDEEGYISIYKKSDSSYGIDFTVDELKMIYEIFKPA